jgi:hypothetical protein
MMRMDRALLEAAGDSGAAVEQKSPCACRG